MPATISKKQDAVSVSIPLVYNDTSGTVTSFEIDAPQNKSVSSTTSHRSMKQASFSKIERGASSSEEFSTISVLTDAQREHMLRT